VCNLAALIAGFAVVAMIEFQFQSYPETLPKQNLLLIGAYASATALTVRASHRCPPLPCCHPTHRNRSRCAHAPHAHKCLTPQRLLRIRVGCGMRHDAAAQLSLRASAAASARHSAPSPRVLLWRLTALGGAQFGLMMNAMVLCALMLAAILKNGKTYVSEEEEAYFMFECRKCAPPSRRPPQSNSRWWCIEHPLSRMQPACAVSHPADAHHSAPGGVQHSMVPFILK
jgi:hypothetical protein